jgi:hypothetical protein
MTLPSFNLTAVKELRGLCMLPVGKKRPVKGS